MKRTEAMPTTTRETPRRRFLARLLLAVFVPMLLLAALHVHQRGLPSAASCQECVDHHCGGHLEQTSPALHDCVLCQFVSLPCLPALAVLLPVVLPVCQSPLSARPALCPVAHMGVNSLRAPPCRP